MMGKFQLQYTAQEELFIIAGRALTQLGAKEHDLDPYKLFDKLMQEMQNVEAFQEAIGSLTSNDTSIIQAEQTTGEISQHKFAANDFRRNDPEQHKTRNGPRRKLKLTQSPIHKLRNGSSPQILGEKRSKMYLYKSSVKIAVSVLTRYGQWKGSSHIRARRRIACI
jgi:hypothetical protein